MTDILTLYARDYDRLVLALKEVAARARFELDHPTEMRDTAFSLIEKVVLTALKESGQ